jgi:hypothetical protein
LLELAWGSANLEEGTIRVVRAIERVTVTGAGDLQKKRIEVHFKQPRTASSRRTVVLPAFALERFRPPRSVASFRAAIRAQMMVGKVGVEPT